MLMSKIIAAPPAQRHGAVVVVVGVASQRPDILVSTTEACQEGGHDVVQDTAAPAQKQDAVYGGKASVQIRDETQRVSRAGLWSSSRARACHH